MSRFINAFDTKCNNLENQLRQGVTLVDMSDDLEALGTQFLLEHEEASDESDVVNFASNIRFTDNFKQKLKKFTQEFVDNGIITKKHFVGQCVICGKDYRPNDIILASAVGEGESICLNCCDELNELTDENELVLVL